MLREGLGLGPTSRSSYVKLERGQREPDAGQRAFLTTFYGAEPIDRPKPLSDQAALVEALREQTAAISALVAALSGPTIPPRPTFEELERWAQELGATLVPPAASGAAPRDDDPPSQAIP